MSTTQRWSYSAGERGRNRVRVFENRHGMLYVEFYDRGAGSRVGPTRQSLGHRDRGKAKQQADTIAGQFGDVTAPRSPEPTLQQLFDNYRDEVSRPLKGSSKQAHDRRAAAMFLGFYGQNRKASSLNVRDWNRFIAARRKGATGPSGRAVGNRQIEYDLKFLLAVLNWATMAREDGEPLLERNPLSGLTLPKERSPHRPLLSDDEYVALLRIAEEADWRLSTALVLCHETGHRIGAVSKLQWENVDLTRALVTWAAAHDKTEHEHTTPLSEAAIEALREAYKLGQPSRWVMPAPRGHDAPVSVKTLAGWRRKAMDAAGLRHLRKAGFHCFRRKFASELKDVPLKDLMALGGWKDPKTVIQCYQQADLGRMREALTNRQSTHRIHSSGAWARRAGKLSSMPAVTCRPGTGGRVAQGARLESGRM